MIEVTGNLWDYPADVRVITTNGAVRKDGCCVMGRGCALEATQRYPHIALALGRLIQQRGNIPHLLVRPTAESAGVWSFPVKHHWREQADLDLIRRSAEILVAECCAYADDWTDRGPVIVMPRPGCGNGRLKWDDVRPILQEILDDRFHVISW
jgi:hypothetical protein